MAQRDAGITDIISTTGLTAITVTMMALVSVIVVPRIAPFEQDHVRVSIETTSDSLVLVHTGGESIPFERAQLNLLIDNVGSVEGMTPYAATHGPTWDHGEELCVVGTAPDCLGLTGTTLQELRLVTSVEGGGGGGAQLAASWDGTVTLP